MKHFDMTLNGSDIGPMNRSPIGKGMERMLLLLMLVLLLVIGGGCTATSSARPDSFETWDEVLSHGSDREVSIFMWGGNNSINRYMDEFIAPRLKTLHGITLKRVPMNAPEYISKLLNEKKGGLETGSADLLWINAENFRTARQGDLLWGPFTDLLPNLKTYYDTEASDLSYDTGIAIEGHEAIWGRAQLVFTVNTERVDYVPRSYLELLAWAKAHPGRFTYPRLPDDFVGSAFVRNAYYELTGKKDEYQREMDRAAFDALSEPVIDYFKELAPYLWREGSTYPATQAQLDELFKNGEVDMTMGFEVGKTAGLIASGVYPDTVDTFVFDTGTIGNAHYLAIPFNAPEKAAALLTINYLQSPEAQMEKMKPDVWGDMPALDVNKIDEAGRTLLSDMESVPAMPGLEFLTTRRLPEMQSTYIDWIKEIWVSRIGGR